MTTTLTPELQEIVKKVKALREYTQLSGFRTTRSQNELIQAVKNPNDLAAVIIALKQ